MPKYRIAIIAAVILVTTVTVFSLVNLRLGSPGSADNPRIDKTQVAYQRAMEFIEERKAEKAVNILQSLIQEDAGSEIAGKALYELAGIYYKQEDFSKSLRSYQKFLKTFPDTSKKEEVKKKIAEINKEILSSSFAGAKDGMVSYVVQPGDTLTRISRKYGTTIEFIQQLNNLKSDNIWVGQKLKINIAKFSIIVDKSSNILILNRNGSYFKTYTISTGRNNSTPVGSFKIEDRMVKPAWTKPGVGIILPDSEEYELGARWLPITKKGYGIHGTNDDSSIGKQSTSGCVRMFNEDVIELYNMVPKGTEVIIVDSMDPASEVVHERIVEARDSTAPVKNQ